MKTPDSKAESGLSPLGFTPELEGYKTPLPPPPEQTIKGKTVLKLSAALYRFSSSVHTFISVDPIVQVLLNNLENSKTAITCEPLPSSLSAQEYARCDTPLQHFNFFLLDMLYIMDDSDKVLIAQKVSSEMYMHFDKVRFVSVAMNVIQFC